MSKFVSAIALANTSLTDVATGALKVQPGQWFVRPDGTKTQYVGVRSGAIVNMSDAGKGDGFVGRTQRFARARWHLAKRHDGVAKLVETAPTSVGDARLGRFAREAVA